MNAEEIRNVKIGAFALGALGLLCAGLNYLKGQNVFTSGTTLSACFASVDGLTTSSPVIFNGFKVGAVGDVEINQYASDPAKRFVVTIDVEDVIDVPKDSRAVIVSTDILGGKGVELILGQSSNLASNGDTLASEVRLGLMDGLAPMKDQVSTLMTSADSVLHDVDALLDARNRQNIDELLMRANLAMRNIEIITHNLSALTAANGALSGTLKSTNDLMTSLSSQTGKVDTVMQNAASVTAELANANLGHAVSQMDSVMGGLNSLLRADGNLHKIANDAKLYDNITLALDNLNRLLVDLRLNPSRYINVSAIKFGGKQLYFSDANTSSNVLRGEVYAVCLSKGKKPIDMPAEVNGVKVLEHYDGSRYRYLLLPFGDKESASSFVSANNITGKYPEAEIELYKDGIRQ